jgi:hypothetical protein
MTTINEINPEILNADTIEKEKIPIGGFGDRVEAREVSVGTAVLPVVLDVETPNVPVQPNTQRQVAKVTGKSDLQKTLLERVNSLMTENYAQSRQSGHALDFVSQFRAVASLYRRAVDVTVYNNGNVTSVVQIPQQSIECTHIWGGKVRALGQVVQVAFYEGDANPDIGDTIGVDGWRININDSIDTSSILRMTATQLQRVADYETNHKDTTTIWRSNNYGMLGTTLMMYNQLMLQNTNGMMRSSTQKLWLTFWLYVRAYVDVSPNGTFWDGVLFPNLIDQWRNRLMWTRNPGHNDIFPYADMDPYGVANAPATPQRMKPTVWGMVLSWDNYVEWLMGWRQLQCMRNDCPNLKLDDVGKFVYLVPLTDVSMSDAEKVLYTLCHMPYPLTTTDDDDADKIDIAVLNDAGVIGTDKVHVTKNAWKCFTDDCRPAWHYSNGAMFRDIYVIWVYQPIQAQSAMYMGPCYLQQSGVYAFQEINGWLADTWSSVPNSFSAVHNRLTTIYGQGRNYKEMYELSVALTHQMPDPKYNGVDDVSGVVSRTGCLWYTPTLTGNAYDDNNWYHHTLPGRYMMIKSGLNCVGAMMGHMPWKNWTDMRIAASISSHDGHAMLGKAFNFFTWVDPSMLTIYDFKIYDRVLVHQTAKACAMKYQICQGNLTLGHRFPKVIGPDIQKEEYRRRLVCGVPGVADGSFRARLEQAWGNRVWFNFKTGYLTPDNWDYWSWLKGDETASPQFARMSISPIYVPIWDWIDLVSANIINEQTKNVWKFDINKWVVERRKLGNRPGSNAADPILRELATHMEKDWGVMWQELWIAYPFQDTFPAMVQIVGKNSDLVVAPTYQSFTRLGGLQKALMLTDITYVEPNWRVLASSNPADYPIGPQEANFETNALVRYGFRFPYRDETAIAQTMFKVQSGVGALDLASNTDEWDANEYLVNV